MNLTAKETAYFADPPAPTRPGKTFEPATGVRALVLARAAAALEAAPATPGKKVKE